MNNSTNFNAGYNPTPSYLGNFSSALVSPDLMLIKGLAAMFDLPSIETLYKDPKNFLCEHAVNVASSLNFRLLSKISSFTADRINQLAELTIGTAKSNPLLESLNFFATVGGGSSSTQPNSPLPTINLLTLTPHVLLLYYTTKKIKSNVAGIFRSLSTLSKGLSTGNWTQQAHQTLFAKNEQGQGFNKTEKISRQYTMLELGEDIVFQSIFTAAWGALAYLTHKGMGQAIEATGSISAQHALTLISTAISLYHFLPLFNIQQKSLLEKSWNAVSPTTPPSYPYTNTFNLQPQIPFKKTPKRTQYQPVKFDTEFDPSNYNPIEISEQRDQSYRSATGTPSLLDFSEEVE